MVEYARNVSIGYMRIDVSSVGGKGSAEEVLLEVGGGKFVICDRFSNDLSYFV